MEFTGGALMLAGVILVRADENQQRRPLSGQTSSGLRDQANPRTT
jgi:hypothetical protein